MSNEKIDIRLFISTVKFNFQDGLLKKVEDNLEGKQLEFYALNIVNVEQLKDVNKNTDEISFLYRIIPAISNIDMTTITVEEFIELCNMPSPRFLSLIDAVLDHIKNLHKNTAIVDSINSKVKNIKELYKVDKMEDLNKKLELEKVTKEKELGKLYEKLATVKNDKERRKEILIRINKLEE